VIPDVLPTPPPAASRHPYLPSVNLLVDYAGSELVYRGNLLTPTQVRARVVGGAAVARSRLIGCAPQHAAGRSRTQTKAAPSLRYSTAEGGKAYTLLAVDADGPDPAARRLRERCHWWLANLPASVDTATAPVDAASTVLDYVPPHPEKGTGHHRMVFCLFEQANGAVDAAELRGLVQGPDRCVRSDRRALGAFSCPADRSGWGCGRGNARDDGQVRVDRRPRQPLQPAAARPGVLPDRVGRHRFGSLRQAGYV